MSDDQNAPTCNAPLQVPAQSGDDLDLEALARAIHHGRFNGPVTTPWEAEDESGKTYCLRIANAVQLHILSLLAPAIDGREVVERCARVADSWTQPWSAADALSAGLSEREFKIAQNSARSIAAAIRKLALTPEEGR